MKICVVSGTFHPEPGGPPTFLYRLLPELIARGHTVEVVTHGEADAPQNYPYPITRISRRLPIPLRLLNFARAVWLAGRRADVFFVGDYGLPVAAINVVLHKPIVMRLVADFAWEFCQRHGWIPATQSVEVFQTATHSWRVRLLRSAQSWYARAASLMIVPSEHVGRLARSWGVLPKVIHNAIDRDLFRRERQLDSEHPTLITVARLAPVKGVDVVIRAFGDLRITHPMAKLIIVGEGPARAELEQVCCELHLAEVVQFTGALLIERIADLLSTAHVFALGSRTEGMPHAALEAMAAGTPVVATHVGGTPEVVADGVNGLLVPPDDPQAMAAAIYQILNDPSLAAKLSQSGLLTLNRFSWPRLVDNYEAALKSVMK